MDEAGGRRPLAPALGRFSLVMAAGVISSALARVGQPEASLAFLAVAALSWVELVVGEAWRLRADPRSYLRALASPRPAVGAFTFGVASAVLGDRVWGLGVAAPAIALTAAGALWGTAWSGVAARLWWGWRRLGDWVGAAGALWLLFPVGLLGGSVGLWTTLKQLPAGGSALGALALALEVLGAVAYLSLVPLLIERLRRRPPLTEVGPSYWIVAGAAALTALCLSDEAGAPFRVALLTPASLQHASAAMLALAGALAPLPLGVTAMRWRRRRELVGAPREYWAAVFPIAVAALACLAVSGGKGGLATVGELVTLAAVIAFLADLTRVVSRLVLPAATEGPPGLPGAPGQPQ